MPLIDAAPYPFEFRPETLALLAIDMQRDYVLPGGYGASLGLDVAPCQAIVPAVVSLVDLFRARGLPVIHTRQTHKPDLSDCPPAKLRRGNPKLRIGDPGPMGRLLIRGEHGSDFIDELQPLPGEAVVDKPGKGAFYATDLHDMLGRLGAEQLVVCGVTTEVCVQSTIREANDRGYDCLLVEDCTASYYPAFRQATIEMIRSSNALIGWTAPLAAVAAAL